MITNDDEDDRKTRNFRDSTLKNARTAVENIPELTIEDEVSRFRWDKKDSLQEMATISPLFVFEKIFMLIFITIFLASLPLFLAKFGFLNRSEAVIFSFYGLCIGLIFILLRAVYWEIYRRSIKLSINGYRLELERGVWHKIYGSIHLQPHTNFYIRQNSWLQMILGTCTLEILPVSTPNPELVSLESLTTSNAHQLRSYLTKRIDQQVTTKPARSRRNSTILNREVD
jgi:hypothetical protein